MSNCSNPPSAGGAPLAITGPLTISTAALWRERLQAWLSTQPAPALDLAGVDACDTAGIQLLASAARSGRDLGRTLCCEALSPAVAQAAAALELDRDTLFCTLK